MQPIKHSMGFHEGHIFIWSLPIGKDFLKTQTNAMQHGSVYHLVDGLMKIIPSLVTVLNNKAASALVIRNFEKKLIYKQV